jgi:hypothetical protein
MSLFGGLVGAAAGGGGAAAGSAAGLASKAGLFTPASLARAAADAVGGKARKEVAAATAAVVGGAGGKIEWTAYNWPSKREALALVHFDLAELATKRDAPTTALVRGGYRWWLATMALCALNFVDSCILSGVVAHGYHGYNIALALVWAGVWAAAGFAVVWRAYHAYAEGSLKSKAIAKAGVVVLLALALTHVLGAFGNVNGVAGFGGTRFAAARAAGASSSSVTLWEAVTAWESLLWSADLAGLGWFAFRIFKGPSTANNAEALPK